MSYFLFLAIFYIFEVNSRNILPMSTCSSISGYHFVIEGSCGHVTPNSKETIGFAQSKTVLYSRGGLSWNAWGRRSTGRTKETTNEGLFKKKTFKYRWHNQQRVHKTKERWRRQIMTLENEVSI